MSDQALPDIPLPSGWAKHVKSAVLHVISLAHYAIVAARGWAANSVNARARARELVVLVGTLKALAIAVRNMDARRRVTLLRQRLEALEGGTALLGHDARSGAGR